jgi:hypothetical protein
MRHDLQSFSTDEVCLSHRGKYATLLKTVQYTDKDGVKFKAKTGMPTDGGSIPRAFWDTIGPPYASKYLPAYIIHDKLCMDSHHLNDADHDSAVALRLEADKLFHEMLRFLGCSRIKAWLMYRGVRMGARSLKRY